jgi:hypothetical protein
MPNILVRDLPDEIHAGLQRRAHAAGQSLQQYLATQLTHLATTPSMSEMMDRIRKHKGGRIGFAAAVRDLGDEHSGR